MKNFIAATVIGLILNTSLFGSVPWNTFVASGDSLSCGKNISVSYIPTSKNSYAPHEKDIELVFDGVFVNYAFEQLGYIEVSAADSTEIKQLIECLKSRAAQKGADAVINIKRHTAGSKATFSGIFIKYVTDEQSGESSNITEPDSMVQKKESSSFGKFLTFIAGAFIVSLFVYNEIHSPDEYDEDY